MPNIRTTIHSYPDAAKCVAAIDALHLAYKATFKRNPASALLCSTARAQSTYELVVSAPNEAAASFEIDWFRAALGAQASSIPNPIQS